MKGKPKHKRKRIFCLGWTVVIDNGNRHLVWVANAGISIFTSFERVEVHQIIRTNRKHALWEAHGLQENGTKAWAVPVDDGLTNAIHLAKRN